MKLGKEITKQVRTSRPAGVVLSVRLSADEAERLQRLAGQCHVSLSDATREALAQWMAWAELPCGATATSNSGADVIIRTRPGLVTRGADVTVWPIPPASAPPAQPEPAP